ncbi:DUF1654 domain-containing protein [Pseudomonas abietaniphila]|uniref:DUF1654 domain-containing protein n=1 Tax=Pseudomonas abietaniphila TaxID=89065 RepID=A0A1G8LLR8_9PSED|nr:DUF1654 domain-containing protein [Pseudomonas abietaniphila]SDI56565.1 Protein of unknown function [Pseudomonas abietaniphila]
MAVQGKIETPQPTQISGVERLTLRVSSMINHPIAQERKWATIHRLDTDGDREWDEVMGVLSEVDGIEMTFNNEDGSVRLSWEAPDDEDPRVEAHDEFESLEPAPF